MTRQRIFYQIGQLAALVLVVCCFWWGVRENNYIGNSRTPLPEVGQLIPHNTKGGVVYITADDARFDTLLGRISLSTLVIIAICLVASGELARILKPPKPPLPPEL